MDTEKGIPIPQKTRRGEWVELAATICKGDSFVVKKQGSVDHIRIVFERFGKGIVARKLPGGDKTGFRVWCTDPRVRLPDGALKT